MRLSISALIMAVSALAVAAMAPIGFSETASGEQLVATTDASWNWRMVGPTLKNP